MNRRTALSSVLSAALALTVTQPAAAQTMDAASQSTFDTVMAFMGAMGAGETDAMSALMAGDMVWRNEGDKTPPWIGTWESKAKVFKFLGLFGENFKTIARKNTDAFASGDTMAVFGDMNAITLKYGEETSELSFALRAKVRDGQVVLWNWFEDSFAVSRAYHGE
ncbi:MAG: nuclear transport factor 2 family protein [Pseudomonadota bacterium]